LSIEYVTDAELVERARAGEPDAFGELVDRHRSAVYRAALAALRSPADAEDAAQEAFLTAYRRLDGFRSEASFKTWLLTIAWHQAINQRRSVTRWLRRTVPAPQGPDGEAIEHHLASPDRSPAERAEDNELRRGIAGAIRALPPKLRDALLLAQAGEYTYEEIAAMLKVPLGTIKWRVSEARRVVKHRLRERGFTDVG
jgi:RNA polymerase sigma-70 factor (ECF subfamily)